MAQRRRRRRAERDAPDEGGADLRVVALALLALGWIALLAWGARRHPAMVDRLLAGDPVDVATAALAATAPLLALGFAAALLRGGRRTRRDTAGLRREVAALRRDLLAAERAVEDHRTAVARLWASAGSAARADAPDGAGPHPPSALDGLQGAVQEVLALLAQDGVTPADLAPETAAAADWLALHRGAVPALQPGEAQPPVLRALIRRRLSGDPGFSDAAERFLVAFDRVLAELAARDDGAVARLSETVSARIFGLLAQGAGLFEGPRRAS